MTVLLGSWIVANAAIVGLLGLGWVTPVGASVLGVLVLSVFTALLIRHAAEELETQRRKEPLESRRTPPRRATRSPAVAIGIDDRRQAQAPS